MEESLSSEDEVLENNKADVTTATTGSGTGGRGKRKRSANVPFHLRAFTFMRIKKKTALIYYHS